jgi:hypothetical protein
MRCSHFWDVTRDCVVVTDVSRQPLDPNFKSPETSELSTQSTLHNIPEEGSCNANRVLQIGSLDIETL